MKIILLAFFAFKPTPTCEFLNYHTGHANINFMTLKLVSK